MKQENGVYQQDNGKWAYRFSILVNGKRVTRRKSTDAQGLPLKTKKAALKARESAMALERTAPTRKAQIPRKTVNDASIRVTQKYYIGISQTGIDLLNNNLDSL